MQEKVAILARLGAEHAIHINGMLMEHLVGTYELLDEWGARANLCDAGLFHAIYGPDGLGSSLVSLEQRDAIVALIGAEVERLVYLYCACDKGHLLPQIGQRAPIVVYRDRFTGAEQPASSQTLADLCELMAANELDVCRAHVDSQILYSDSTQSLLRIYAVHASPAARAALLAALPTAATRR